MMRDHVCVGSKAVQINVSEVWWEKDGYGIPLALVCKDCAKEKMAQFRFDVKDRYQTDDDIGDTDGAWEDDCYSRDLEW
jgi:hypothetical protein